MTTETIEVERTVTDEETMKICNGCGTEIEEKDSNSSEPITYKTTNLNVDGDIHLHRKCTGQINGLETTPPSDQETTDTFVLAFDKIDVKMAVSGLIPLGISVGTFATDFFLAIGILFFIFSLGLYLFLILTGYQQGKEGESLWN